MVRMSVVDLSLAALMRALLVPAAWAQQSSGIAGLVKDTSGAVLPGVTVEAASPALIEKRSAPPSPTARGATTSSTCGPAPIP